MINVVEIDRGWDHIKRELRMMDDSYTKVGVQQGAIHRAEDGELSDMVVIAAANEIGTLGRVLGGSTRSGGTVLASRGIPSRPFMRNAFDRNKTQLVRLSADMYSDVVLKRKTVEQALSTMGEFMTAKVKLSIRNLRTPPNAPSTIKRKKSRNPLIDQGQLVQSITHVEVLR